MAVRRKDNSSFPSDVICSLIKNNKNEPEYFVAIFTDITERKKAEQALKESEAKFRAAADLTYDWEYWIDSDGEIIYISPSCERITGYSRNEFIEEPRLLTSIIHPEDADMMKNHKHQISDNSEVKQIEYRIITKSGNERWIGHVCQIVYNSNRTSIGIRGSNRDITDRKRAEEILKESQEKLRESNISKDKFFSIIAHDLKSPFNAMLGFSEILNENFDEYSSDEQKKFVSFIYQGLQNTYNLLENLLQWSRSQKGMIDFRPEKTNLFLLTNEAIDLQNQSVEQKCIKLTNQIDENVFVDADKDMLSTIIRNLLSNAIKFTTKHGEVKIKAVSIPTEDKKGFIEVVVNDTGVGISKEIQSKLFDIGENTSTEGTNKEKGTGLGLILCKEFIEKHGGKIWVESEVGKGSSFCFTLPCS